MFPDYWKVLVFNFLEMENAGFFEPKSWGEYDIYWLLKSSCFEPFGNEKHGLCWAKKLMERWYLLLTEKFCFAIVANGKYDPLFSQKVDGKIIFSLSFWAFYDILGLGKYGFSCIV